MYKNMCKQARSYVFIQVNYISTCSHACMYFLQLVLTFTPINHYIIKVKGLFNSLSFVSFKCPTTLFQLPSLCVRGWYSPYISNIYTISRYVLS